MSDLVEGLSPTIDESSGISDELREQDITARTYFSSLGLNWEVLKGKNILDIGAGDAMFAKAAKREGITVTSMDIEPGGMGGDGQIPLDVPYIVADFRRGLDLPPESFDEIVARASVHSMVEVEEDLVAVIAEAKRLLKPGGEFRFTSIGILKPIRRADSDKWYELLDKVTNGEEITPEEDAWGAEVWPAYEQNLDRDKELKGLPMDERMKKIHKFQIADLKKIEPSIIVHEYTSRMEWKGEIKEYPDVYYVMQKLEPPTTEEK